MSIHNLLWNITTFILLFLIWMWLVRSTHGCYFIIVYGSLTINLSNKAIQAFNNRYRNLWRHVCNYCYYFLLTLKSLIIGLYYIKIIEIMQVICLKLVCFAKIGSKMNLFIPLNRRDGTLHFQLQHTTFNICCVSFVGVDWEFWRVHFTMFIHLVSNALT